MLDKKNQEGTHAPKDVSGVFLQGAGVIWGSIPAPLPAATPGTGLEQVEVTRARDRVEAGLRLELTHDAVEMPLDGPDGDDERVRDVLVGPTRRQQPQDLQLTRGHRFGTGVDHGG